MIIRHKDLEWEDRVNVDGWPCRAGMYYDDRKNNLTLRLIDYPVGSTEPRHVHAGTHATTVLKGRAIIDELTLCPLDVVLGPGGEPHGPLHYPEGCQLLSAFQGDYLHGEVEQLSDKNEYRLVQAEKLPWDGQTKMLLEGVGGRLTVQAIRLSAGESLPAERVQAVRAYLVLEGRGPGLGVWDMLYLPPGETAAVVFPEPALLLSLRLD